MLKNIVTTLIDKVVGEYVEGVNATDLKISIFRGNVSLSMVKLKRGALDGLNLPVTVSQGVIGKLNIRIPWKNLRSQPVVLDMEDLFLVIKPNNSCEWDEEQEREKRRKIKLSKLSRYESLRSTKENQKSTAPKENDTDEETEKKKSTSGFWSYFTDTEATKSIMEAIVNNLQFGIHNVHLRYEDTSDEKKPHIAGFSLEDLTLQSCDETWQKKFILETGEFAYKLGELKKLAVYSNSNDRSISQEYFYDEMKRLITDHHTNQYILQPTNGRLQAKLQHKKEVDIQKPRYDIDVIVDEVSASLDDLQYRHVLQEFQYMLNYQHFEKFRSVRPIGLTRESPPREWWKFTTDSVRKTLQSKYFVWDDALQRSKNQTRYIELYKRKSEVPWLPKLDAENSKEFEDLEDQLDIEDIIFLREMAEVEIARQSEMYAELKETKKTTTTAKRGWLSWLTGGGSTDDDDTVLGQTPFQLSDQERRDLYKSVGYDIQQKAIEVSIPKDYVQFCLNIKLRRGKISLADAKTRSKLIEAQYEDANINFKLREDITRFIVDMSLGSFSILDCYNKDTCFKKILSRRESFVTEPTPKMNKNALATLKVESKPSDNADIFVGITLDELDFVANVPLIQRLIAFIVVAGYNVDLSSIEELARRSLASMQHQAQVQLKLALETNRVIDLDVNVKAPVLILPETCSVIDGTPAIIVDLGQTYVKSDIDTMERKRRLKNQQISQSDYYDKFNFSIDNAQIQTCSWYDGRFCRREQLLENVSLEMHIEKCVTPFNDQLPTLKTMGSVPTIALNASVERLEMITRIFNAFSLLIGDPTGSSSQEILQVSGHLHNGEGTNWVNYFCELRDSGSIALYESKDDRKPKYSINLSRSQVRNLREAWAESEAVQEHMKQVKIPAGEDKNIFVIVLPQGDSSKDLVFMFKCPDANFRSAWIGMLRATILSLKKSYDGDSRTDIAGENDLQVSDRKISRTKANIMASFQLSKMSVTVQHQRQTISQIVLQGLDLAFENRNFDNTLSLKLHSFSVSDLLDPTSGKYIFSSGQDTQSDLAHLTFIQAKPESPKFISEAGMVFMLQFNTLQVFFDPIILSRFVLLGYELMDVYNNLGTKMVTYAAIQEKTSGGSIDYWRRVSSFKVTMHMNDAWLKLIDHGATFMSFDMKNSDVNILITPSELLLSGAVGDLIVNDHSEQTSYRETLGLNSKDHSLINFSFEKKQNLHREAELGTPYYDKFVKVEMRSVKLVYLHRLITKFRLYLSEGPLMDSLRTGGAKAAKFSIDAVKKQSTSVAMVQLDLTFVSPTVIVPTSHKSVNHVTANLGKITVHNRLHKERVLHDNWMEEYTVLLSEMNLKTKESGLLIPVIGSANMELSFKRSVKTNEGEVPNLSFYMLSSPVTIALNHRQYQMIFQIIDNNIGDTADIIARYPPKNDSVPEAEHSYSADHPHHLKSTSMFDDIRADIFRSEGTQSHNQVTREQEQLGDDQRNTIQSEFIFEFPHMNLQLIRGNGARDDHLARLNMYGFKVIYLSKFDNTRIAEVRVHVVNAFDRRAESKSLFKEFVTNIPSDDMFQTAEQSTREVVEVPPSGTKPLNQLPSVPEMLSSPSSSTYAPRRQEEDFVIFEYENQGKDTIIQLTLGNPRIIFVPDIVMEIRDFFMNRYAKTPGANRSQHPASTYSAKRDSTSSLDKTHDLEITTSIWLGEDIRLSAQRQMLVKQNPSGEAMLHGEGHTIFLCSDIPVISIEDGMTLKLNNMRLVYVGDLMQYVLLGKNAKFIAPTTHGVMYDKRDTEEDLLHEMEHSTNRPFSSHKDKVQAAVENVMVAAIARTTPATSTQDVIPDEQVSPAKEEGTRFMFSGKFGKPKIIFPDDATDHRSRLFVLEALFKFSYTRPYNSENGSFHITDFKAYTESADGLGTKGAPIIEPVNFFVEMNTPEMVASKIERYVKAQVEGDVNVRISYQDVLMIKKIVDAFTAPKPKEEKDLLQLIIPNDDDDEGEEGDGDNGEEEEEEEEDDDDDMDQIAEFDYSDDTAYNDAESTESDDEYNSCDEESNDTTHVYGAEQLSDNGGGTNDIAMQENPKTNSPIATNENSFEVTFESGYTISVEIVDDFRGYDLPLLDVRVARLVLDPLKIQMANQHVVADLQFDVSANFYNFGLAVWEPIVESFGCEASFTRTSLQDEPTSFMYKAQVHSALEHIGRSEDDTKDIFKPSTVNVNISKSMIDTVMTTSKLWREGLASNTPLSVRFDPFTIRNHSGQTISFAKEDIETETVSLLQGEEHGFKFTQSKESKSEWGKEYVIKINIPGYPVTSVDIHRVSSKMILNEKEKQCAIVEVEQSEGRKTITIRSGIRVFNGTGIPWNLGLKVKEKLSQFGVVQPQESYGIPICNVNEGTLCIQPTGRESQYEWSEVNKGLSLSAFMRSNRKTRLFKCKHIDDIDGSHTFHCVTKTETKHRIDERFLTMAENNQDWVTLLQQFDYTVYLRPPLSFENLLGCDIDFALFDKIAMSSKKKRITRGTLARGEKAFFYTANLRNNLLLRVRLRDPAWKTDKIALINSTEQTNVPLTQRLALYDNHDRSLYLHFEYRENGDSFRDIIVYSPYWIKNNTGQHLSIRENSIPAAGLDIFETLKTTDSLKKAEPMMLSFDDPSPNNKIAIAINGSNFSHAFSIDNAGIAGDIELHKDGQIYNIGVYVAVGPGKFRRTKIVTFAALHVIINKSDEPIQVKQKLSPYTKTLLPDEKTNFYWYVSEEQNLSKEKRLLSINVDEQQFEWSPPFRVDALGVTPLKLLPKRDVNPRILNVNLTMEQGTAFIIVEKPEKPPYIIENMLNSDIEFSQISTNTWWILRAGSKVSFAWDDNTRAQKLKLRIFNGYTVHKPIAINRVGKEMRIRTKDGTNLYIFVRAEGPTRVLNVSYGKQSVNDRKMVERLKVDLLAEFPEIGFSFINNIPTSEEIAYLFLEGLRIDFKSSDKNQYLEAALKRLQLDNMSEDSQLPVTLTNTHSVDDVDFIRVSIRRSLVDKTINMFHYFGFGMQEANLAIDNSFASKLSVYLENIFDSSDKEDQDTVDKMLNSIDDPSLDPIGSNKSMSIYFDLFELHPIKVNVTFKLTHMDSEKNSLLLLLNNIGITLLNVDDAPLKLNSLIMKHPFMTRNELLDKIKKHYKTAVLSEIYKIVGSFDILGNPIGLVNDLSMGLKDFFYEPASAIVRPRGDLRAGVIRGTSSLVSSSIHGTFNTASKLTGSMGKALGMLTFDREYTREREKHSSRKATTFREGLSEGASAAFKGFVDGSTGLIIKPIEGASRSGARGFLKGVGIGIIGIPMKPVAGFFDLVTKTTEGISNIGKENRGRKRLARVLREDGAVTPYSGSAAYTQHMLRTVCRRNDYPLSYCLGHENTLAILTKKTIFNINLSNSTLEWRVDMDQIASMERSTSTRMVIIVEAIQPTKKKRLFRNKAKHLPPIPRQIDSQESEKLDEFQHKVRQRLHIYQEQQEIGETSEEGLLLFRGMMLPQMTNQSRSPRDTLFGGSSLGRSSPRTNPIQHRNSLTTKLKNPSPLSSPRGLSPRLR